MAYKNASLCMAVMSIWAALSPSPAFSQPSNAPGQISPSAVDLGYLGTSGTPKSGTITIGPNVDKYPLITRIEWASGSPPSFVSLANMPPVGTYIGEPTLVAYEFDVSTAGYFHDTLLIDLQCVEGSGCPPDRPTQTFELDFTARVDCLSSGGECKPTGPVCRIDFNSEDSVWFPTTLHADNVSPSIAEATALHYAGNLDYTMPVSVIWKLAGLSELFAEPSSGCCACDDNCLPPISFTHSATSELVATFKWKHPSGAPTAMQSVQNPLFDARLTLPSEMTGTAIVGGSYVELWFSNTAVAPELSATFIGSGGDYSAGTTIYDGPIMCTGTSLQYATIRHPEPTTDVPKIHLYAADQTPTP